MNRAALDQLEAAIDAVGSDLATRVSELACKSGSGTLTPDERSEYEEIVRLNDLLALARIEAEEVYGARAAS